MFHICHYPVIFLTFSYTDHKSVRLVNCYGSADSPVLFVTSSSATEQCFYESAYTLVQEGYTCNSMQ